MRARVSRWLGVRRATPLDPRMAYARLAPAYPPEAHNEVMRLEERTVFELLPNPRGRRVLDIGCGSGRYLRRLHERGAALVAGCDPVAEMLVQACRVAPRVAQGAAEALPFREASFDLAVCGLVVGHCVRLQPVLAELARVLRPGGVAVYSDIHPLGTLAGWERWLPDASGQRVPIRQHVHLFGSHLQACLAAGLRLDAIAEPVSEQAPPESRGWPALLVVRVVKGL